MVEDDCLSMVEDIHCESLFDLTIELLDPNFNFNFDSNDHVSLSVHSPQTILCTENASTDTVNNISSLSAPGTVVSQRRRRFCDMKNEHGQWIVPRIPLPRIVKRDIRRSYAQMLTNVYNSHDEELLHRFVSQMIPDDYCYRFGFDGKCYDLSSADKLILHQFCFEHMCLSPDVVFHFSAERIKLRSDDTATLTGHFSVTGNMIFHTPYDEKLVRDEHQMSPSFRVNGNRILFVGNRDDMQRNYSRGSNQILTNHSSIGDNNRHLRQAGDAEFSISVFPEDFALFPVPKIADFLMTGEFVMRMNSQAKIETIELSMHQYLLNQLPAKPLSSSSSSSKI